MNMAQSHVACRPHMKWVCRVVRQRRTACMPCALRHHAAFGFGEGRFFAEGRARTNVAPCSEWPASWRPEAVAAEMHTRACHEASADEVVVAALTEVGRMRFTAAVMRFGRSAVDILPHHRQCR